MVHGRQRELKAGKLYDCHIHLACSPLIGRQIAGRHGWCHWAGAGGLTQTLDQLQYLLI
ncbi:hypothetical protein NMD1_01935 [Novosphingobium sp. MD-1]|nr:hypothetical protein NMD1_01935 [Novosphingobium sp. MD-1]